MSAMPVVYFIDDSATMREVIKIAFRRENINVVTCHDGTSAINMMEGNPPDVVITDLIMPGKDGYEVCQYIKQTPKFARTPVVLMSGVVNRSVAEKAFAVKADELIRKPFQPQDLITRVRHLLNPHVEPAAVPASVEANASAIALSSIFATPARTQRKSIVPINDAPAAQRPAVPALAATAAAAMNPSMPAPAVSIPGAQITGAVSIPVPPANPQGSGRVPMPPGPGMSTDAGRLRLELLRLQSQVKKLEAELRAEREYTRALEEHIKTLQETE